MGKQISGAVLTTFLCLAFAGSTRADEAEKPKGIRGEILMILGVFEKRTLDLLEALPQGKLPWRPAEGVRSGSEIFMHMAVSPFYMATVVGLPRPKDISGKLVKSVTDKAEIREHLKRGFHHARKAVLAVADDDLDTTKKNPWFGVALTKRLYLIGGIAMHLASHLAQLGIYARLNGVTPPWIIEEMKQRAEMKKKGEAAPGEKKEEGKGP